MMALHNPDHPPHAREFSLWSTVVLADGLPIGFGEPTSEGSWLINSRRLE